MTHEAAKPATSCHATSDVRILRSGDRQETGDMAGGWRGVREGDCCWGRQSLPKKASGSSFSLEAAPRATQKLEAAEAGTTMS